MNNYYKEQCPKWVDETETKFDLMLGDDSDSLLSCNLLEQITNDNWKVNYFYDFESFYRQEETGLKTIGVDMAFTSNVMCFDNHVTKQFVHSKHNPFMVNMNVFNKYISADKNYYKKYPFSTLMMIMSYYDIPLPTSETGKELLLACDSAFKGHYTSKEHFKKIHTDWLKTLGFGSLVDTLDNRTPNFFYALQREYGLNEKIILDENGFLQSNINLEAIQSHLDWKLELPQQHFSLVKECVREGHVLGKKIIPDRSELISMAFTGKDYVSYTHRG